MEKFYSNGKLLLSGEYAVLDGAKSLALPTKYGQSLEVSCIDIPVLIWESFSVEKQLWFQAEIPLDQLSKFSKSNPKFDTLQKIILEAQNMNSSFLKNGKGAFVQTFLTFPNNWGLGTSSTLINNIADWAQVDPFQLLENSFGGSGYDIACAKNNIPIHYQKKDNKPQVSKVIFEPEFSDNLFFVYLNQKQNSKEGIQLYKSASGNKLQFCDELSALTEQITEERTLKGFESLLRKHEKLVGSFLNIQPLQDALFSDYFGAIKSLGAWGGDFILATGNKETPSYFKERGYETVIPYKEMILEHKT